MIWVVLGALGIPLWAVISRTVRPHQRLSPVYGGTGSATATALCSH
jgi:hypothetical protein